MIASIAPTARGRVPLRPSLLLSHTRIRGLKRLNFPQQPKAKSWPGGGVDGRDDETRQGRVFLPDQTKLVPSTRMSDTSRQFNSALKAYCPAS